MGTNEIVINNSKDLTFEINDSNMDLILRLLNYITETTEYQQELVNQIEKVKQ